MVFVPQNIEKNAALRKISLNLIKIRKKHGFSQEYLAEQLGMHLVSYQRYENYKKPRNIPIYFLIRICAYYKISLDSITI